MRQLLYRMRNKVVIRLHHDTRQKVVEIQCLCLVPDDDVNYFLDSYTDGGYEAVSAFLKFRWPFSVRFLEDSDLRLSLFFKSELPEIINQWTGISPSFYGQKQFMGQSTKIGPHSGLRYDKEIYDSYHPDILHMLSYFLGQINIEYEREEKQPHHHALGLIENRLTGFINQERERIVGFSKGSIQPIK